LETTWFVLIALMLIGYVVLDGFDLGAGAVSPFIARDHEERRIVLRTIGPVWDGNEVWLIAAGGALYYAFPLLYASSFSGFYLPLMIVLWLLMLRGIGIELRSHMSDRLWWSLFDFLFAVASALLAVFFGAAIGNVLRGVPLGPDGYFFEALWTNFLTGAYPGILDWYTVVIGLLALASLSVHGANYVALKTAGALNARARRVSSLAWPAVVILTAISLPATVVVRPQIMHNFILHTWGWAIPVAVAVSLLTVRLANGRDGLAFASSTLYLVAMLSGAAFATYPNLLPASTDPSYSLTIYNARAGSYSLRVGLVWWSIGMVLATAYFIFVYVSFRGKVTLDKE